MLLRVHVSAETDSTAQPCRLQSDVIVQKQCVLTMHSEYVTVMGPMSWWLSLPTLDEVQRRQTRSPLVPNKLPRLLPHKGRVPGRSRVSKLGSLSAWVRGAWWVGDGEQGPPPWCDFPQSVWPLQMFTSASHRWHQSSGFWWRSMQRQIDRQVLLTDSTLLIMHWLLW
jgi:hypothetical protein